MRTWGPRRCSPICGTRAKCCTDVLPGAPEAVVPRPGNQQKPGRAPALRRAESQGRECVRVFSKNREKLSSRTSPRPPTVVRLFAVLRKEKGEDDCMILFLPLSPSGWGWQQMESRGSLLTPNRRIFRRVTGNWIQTTSAEESCPGGHRAGNLVVAPQGQRLGQGKGTDFVFNQLLPNGSAVRNLPANAGDLGSIPGWGRSPGEGNGNLLQYSCRGNPMDRGAWRATVHAVTESDRPERLKQQVEGRSRRTFSWC